MADDEGWGYGTGEEETIESPETLSPDELEDGGADDE